MAPLLSPKARLLSNFFYDTGLEKILHIICSLKIASTSNAICWQGTLAPRNPVGKGGKGSFGHLQRILPYTVLRLPFRHQSGRRVNLAEIDKKEPIRRETTIETALVKIFDCRKPSNKTCRRGNTEEKTVPLHLGSDSNKKPGPRQNGACKRSILNFLALPSP